MKKCKKCTKTPLKVWTSTTTVDYVCSCAGKIRIYDGKEKFPESKTKTKNYDAEIEEKFKRLSSLLKVNKGYDKKITLLRGEIILLQREKLNASLAR